MNYAELQELRSGPVRAAKRAAVVAFFLVFGAWCTIAVFRGRDTHAMTADSALAAMRTPLTEGERKVAVAAIRRQAFEIIARLRAETARPDEIGDEARAALVHICKESSQ